MLIRRESGFYYRKSIPERHRERFGKREIWISLRTSNRFEAIGKGRYLDSYISEMLENGMSGNWNIQDYYKELAVIVRKNPADLQDKLIALRQKYLIGSPENFINNFVSAVSNRHTETLSKIKKLNIELEQAKQSGNSENVMDDLIPRLMAGYFFIFDSDMFATELATKPLFSGLVSY